ncbi:unnamed protein product, partial [Ectocarpus sp. 8 AP-2014]
MAAAGPHLSLKSWSPLFQAVGVLGCAVLLPEASAADGDEEEEERQGEGEGKEGDLWEVLEAVWEFIFLQVIPEALPALREQHATRLEEAFRALFGSLESLWPLLTGPVAQRRRPRLADDFYRSRSLWLQPLLSWVSAAWLPRVAREAAAIFVQRSLLPFLHASSCASATGGGDEGGPRGDDDPSVGVSPRKTVRLVGDKLCAVEGEGGSAWALLSGEPEEAGLLAALKSAAVAATTEGTAPRSPPAAPGGAARSRVDPHSPEAPRNPFALSAARRGNGGSSAASGWSRTPWEDRLGVGNSATPSSESAGRPLSGSALAQITYSSPAAAPEPTATTPGVRRGSHYPKAGGNDSSQARQGGDSTAGGGGGGGGGGFRDSRGRSTTASTEGWSLGVRPEKTASRAVSNSTANDDDEVGSSSGPRGRKTYVTAAEAAAVRASEAKANTAKVAAAAAAVAAAAARPRGSVVERWREMQRRQMGETTEVVASAPAASQSRPLQQQQEQARSPRNATAQTTSKEARAAFATAAQAAARRGDSPDGGNGSLATTAAGAATLDYASLAEASATELHKLVLSSWTVPELFAASTKSARSGGRFQGPKRGHEVGRSSSSSLWLSKVPTRFQSVEQYLEVFRGLVLDEIFATLVAAIDGGGSGGRGGGRGGPPEAMTLRVASFVEDGKGGFGHVTMVADDGGGGSHRFAHDDVLLLTLVKSSDGAAVGGHVGGDGGSAATTTACLGLFDKEPRGAARGPTGMPGSGRSSVRAKVLFRSTAPGDRGRNRSTIERGAGAVIPKKATAESRGQGQGEEEAASAVLRAFRELGSQVRVTRLEGLSTSTREFVALEASPRVALLHHILQATSEPSLQPLPETPQRAPGNSTTSNDNLWATKLAPPYLVDEASFADACKRLSSVEDSALLGKSGAGGGSPAIAAGLAADVAGPAESLMRSLGCLASFR